MKPSQVSRPFAWACLAALPIASACGAPGASGSSPVPGVVLLCFAGWLLAQGLKELSEAGALPESTVLLVGAFFALAVPTLYFFLRKPKLVAAG